MEDTPKPLFIIDIDDLLQQGSSPSGQTHPDWEKWYLELQKRSETYIEQNCELKTKFTKQDANFVKQNG